MIDVAIQRLPRTPSGGVNIAQVMREYEWRTNQWVTPAEYLAAVVCLTALSLRKE
ncbi:MAG: hypothetical protein WAK16_04040 [Candidatus Cybelea sp.]